LNVTDVEGSGGVFESGRIVTVQARHRWVPLGGLERCIRFGASTGEAGIKEIIIVVRMKQLMIGIVAVPVCGLV